MSNSQLAVHAAWYMGVQVGLLQPVIGRKPRNAGVDRGTVDGHGVGITCSNTDGVLRSTCPNRVQHCIAREARRAGVHVMDEVFGAFTRALQCGTRIWRSARNTYAGILPGRQRQGIVPDLQIGTALYELKGIRSDRSHANYNGGCAGDRSGEEGG
jgi:hypothetical protein